MQEVIIACDVGLKRIGLATYTQGITLSLEPIIRKNRNQAASDLDLVLAKRKATHLVIGLPSEQDMINRIKHFANLLKFSGKIIFINEDYSSKDAMQNLFHLGKKSRQEAQKNGILDSLSAVEILKRYLQEHL